MPKIKNLIFDFGDVFINLDKTGAAQNALNLFKLKEFPEELVAINTLYEQGYISTGEFLEFYVDNFKHLAIIEVVDAWNFILKDFPKKRLDFIKNLANDQQYRLFLLSNTNELHIEHIKTKVPFYEEFKSCFDQFYLSHEIQLRKPNADIFQFVLEETKISANESLFIDDTKANTDMAQSFGFQIWNINETTEDVIDLFNLKKALF